eukprot:755447-Alexandrium_andersonii.AAC.1
MECQEKRNEGGTMGQGDHAQDAGSAMGTSSRKGRHRGQGKGGGTKGEGTAAAVPRARGTGVHQEETQDQEGR